MAKKTSNIVHKQRSVDPGFNAPHPFASHSESSDQQKKSKHSRAPSDPSCTKSIAKKGEDLENKSLQELEEYAVYKAEETTIAVHGCLKIAEEIREDANKTFTTLHQQGEQITRTHAAATKMEQDLSMGEKLLGSLGGIFSKPWKPKKTRAITGPVITKDDSFKRKANHQEQKERLRIRSPKGKSNTRTYNSEPSSTMDKVEIEKVKQDDALSDLSDVLGQLKGMAVDMGGELDRQNKALDHFNKDVDGLNHRVKGANQRARHLNAK